MAYTFDISSSSTIETIKNYAADNADYFVNSDVTKCTCYIYALELLLIKLAEEVEHGDERVRASVSAYEKLLNKAKEWFEEHTDLPTTVKKSYGVRHFDVSGGLDG